MLYNRSISRDRAQSDCGTDQYFKNNNVCGSYRDEEVDECIEHFLC